MLENKTAAATIAVKDIDAAKKFYEGKLGLKPEASEESEVLEFKSGDTPIFVYKSQFAGTNKATAATWVVDDDIKEVVKALKEKGITFEHYDFPDMKLEGDLHVSGNMKAAWFKDPDGNILALVGK